MPEGVEKHVENLQQADEFWMRAAIVQAMRAASNAEVPVGACLVSADGALVASAGNLVRTLVDPTAHAEIAALRAAAQLVGNYRLIGATMYSTIEPCAMCAGALVNARIKRLVYGARDERFGAVESIFRICDSVELNHRIEISAGVLADECKQLMQEFFRARRKQTTD